jgi:hypothetical protein
MFSRSMNMPSSQHSSMALWCKGIEFFRRRD